MTVKKYQLIAEDLEGLKSLYFPNIRGGGLWIATSASHHVDEDVKLVFDCLGEQFVFQSSVVMRIPADSLGINSSPGIVVVIPHEQERLQILIENHLAGRMNTGMLNDRLL